MMTVHNYILEYPLITVFIVIILNINSLYKFGIFFTNEVVKIDFL